MQAGQVLNANIGIRFFVVPSHWVATQTRQRAEGLAAHRVTRPVTG